VRGGWKRNEEEDQKTRRSIYTFVRRNSRYPMFQAFDMPDTHESCSRRTVSVTAPQALNLLNDKTVLMSAQAFAGRVLKGAGADVDRQITLAYRLAFARAPEIEERRMTIDFLDRQSALIKSRIEVKQPVALPFNCEVAADTVSRARAAALVDFCHALFNSNEFVYVN
jgi:hypothetical protein